MESQVNQFAHSQDVTDNQSQVQKLLEDYGKGFREKNLELILSVFAEDVVGYYEMNSLHISGKEAYKKFWKEWMDASGTNDFEIHGMRMVIDENVAFAHYLIHKKCLTREGKKINHWSRCTTAFRKYKGQWLITHEHTSVPVDSESGRAIWDAEHSEFIKQ